MLNILPVITIAYCYFFLYPTQTESSVLLVQRLQVPKVAGYKNENIEASVVFCMLNYRG